MFVFISGRLGSRRIQDLASMSYRKNTSLSKNNSNSFPISILSLNCLICLWIPSFPWWVLQFRDNSLISWFSRSRKFRNFRKTCQHTYKSFDGTSKDFQHNIQIFQWNIGKFWKNVTKTIKRLLKFLAHVEQSTTRISESSNSQYKLFVDPKKLQECNFLTWLEYWR